MGRIGRLPAAETLREFAARVARVLDAPGMQVVGERNRRVQRVAIVCGAGDDALGDAASASADVFLTGEARYHRAIDQVPKGGVIVIDTGGARGSCTGELMCTGARCHGAVSTIVNGTIRDLAEIEALRDYPVFATGLLPVTAVGRMEDTAINVDVNFRGIRVQPGDIIFADRDGVVVVPREAAETVARLADEIGTMERNFKQQILDGVPLVEVFNEV